jgi:hypothetical protein
VDEALAAAARARQVPGLADADGDAFGPLVVVGGKFGSIIARKLKRARLFQKLLKIEICPFHFSISPILKSDQKSPMPLPDGTISIPELTERISLGTLFTSQEKAQLAEREEQMGRPRPRRPTVPQLSPP